MRKWLILIYILSVLTISGLAKASIPSNVVINEYSYDASQMKLSVSGSMFGNCGPAVSAAIINSQATEDFPVLLISINSRTNNCDNANNIENKFDLVLDIRELGVQPNTTYYAAFNNLIADHSEPLFLINVPSGLAFNYPELKQVTGILLKDSEGRYFLEENGQRVFVKSEIKLEKYLNSKVIFDALSILHQVGPGFDIGNHSPLRENQYSESDLMYIFSISSIY